jgi:diaminopimelate epimerase
MHLTKHHGLGNDFLVLLDADGSHPVRPERVRQLCDRRRGIGADGLIRATAPADAGRPGAAVAVMSLTNADGSPAEMSGNGIRCLAQALLDGGWATGGTVPIDTVAGRRVVTVHGRPEAGTHDLSVDMGPAIVGGDLPEWAGGPIVAALDVGTGNPHVVLRLAASEAEAARSDTAQVSLVELGERVNAKVPGGANVHLLAAGSDEDGGGITIRTYERGVGPTLACGTGACASAAAARAWGLVGDQVSVRMPGGTARVTLGEAVELRGPATFIAAVEVADS